MSVQEQIVFTCDRCGATATVPMHNPKGERNGPPVGWKHIDRRDRLHDGDICESCKDSYDDWWMQA